MKKVSFGIPGLDDALHGGVEAGSATLISGGPGTGKTSMGLHFVYSGARSGSTAMYVSLEEKKEKVLETAKMLGMKGFPSLVRSGRIVFMGMEDILNEESRIAEKILRVAKNRKVKRMVVDTLTTMAVYTTSPRWKVAATHPSPKLVLFQPTKANVKQFLVNFINTVNRINATMLFLSEDNDEYTLSQEYICDSVIEMERPPFDAAKKGAVLLRVLKTRRSSHSPGVHVVEIKGGKGVSVVPAAEALK